MGRNLLYKTAQLFVLFALLSLESGATEKKCLVSGAAGHAREQYTGAIDHIGEIELTGAYSITGHSQQVKKASLQLWCANSVEPDRVTGSELYVTRMQNVRSSIHLAYIFPFYYFW